MRTSNALARKRFWCWKYCTRPCIVHRAIESGRSVIIRGPSYFIHEVLLLLLHRIVLGPPADKTGQSERHERLNQAGDSLSNPCSSCWQWHGELTLAVKYIFFDSSSSASFRTERGVAPRADRGVRGAELPVPGRFADGVPIRSKSRRASSRASCARRFHGDATWGPKAPPIVCEGVDTT